jgi:hypothetical protein
MGLETTLLMNNNIEPYTQRPMLPLYILFHAKMMELQACSVYQKQ